MQSVMFVDEYTIKTRQEGVFKNMFLLLFTNEIGFLIHIYILNRVLTVHDSFNEIRNKLNINFLPHWSDLTHGSYNPHLWTTLLFLKVTVTHLFLKRTETLWQDKPYIVKAMQEIVWGKRPPTSLSSVASPNTGFCFQ